MSATTSPSHLADRPYVVGSQPDARRGLQLTIRQAGQAVDVVRTPARHSSLDTTADPHTPAPGEHDALLAPTGDRDRSNQGEPS
ncbi:MULTISPECIES: hypothetical protein [unclassified Blastococcus]